MLGWLALALADDGRSSPPPPAVRAAAAALSPHARPADMSVRELRLLPGIGAGRALATARARAAHDPAQGSLAWEEVPGVGDGTAARVRAWLAAHGVRATEPDGADVSPPASTP